jgi:superfamily I DNA/RNA helicase
VSQAFERGSTCVAVIARNNDQVAELRTYLCREGMYPRQIGTRDFEEAREEIEQLPLLVDTQSVAIHALDRINTLVPTLDAAVVRQVRERLSPAGITFQRAGAHAAPLLNALNRIYVQGPQGYFSAIVAAIQVCAERGHHLPRVEAVRAIRAAAETPIEVGNEAETPIERYSRAVMNAAHSATNVARGLLVMTAHQCKGKEFDAVVLADGFARFWPDSDDSRKLFYVVITRAMRSLTIIVPDRGATPLAGMC